jgi:hypothetical protein
LKQNLHDCQIEGDLESKRNEKNKPYKEMGNENFVVGFKFVLLGVLQQSPINI